MTKQNNGGKSHPHDPIEANLKRVYDQVAEEEIPDRFKDLLAQLKAQDDSPSNDQGGAQQ